MLIAGDFNAHLDPLGGPRGQDTPNHQGVLLQQLISRCDLYTVSLSSVSDGPQYTFWNTQTRTSVDYIISCLQASRFILHYFTHEFSSLNTSDYLPISTIDHISTVNHHLHPPQGQKIDWVKAQNTKFMSAYQEQSLVIHPLLGTMYDSPAQLPLSPSSLSKQPTTPCPLCHQTKRRKSGLRTRTYHALQHSRKLPGTNGLTAGVHKQVLSTKVWSGLEMSLGRGSTSVHAAHSERAKIQRIDRKFKQNFPSRFKLSKPKGHGSTLRASVQVLYKILLLYSLKLESK